MSGTEAAQFTKGRARYLSPIVRDRVQKAGRLSGKTAYKGKSGTGWADHEQAGKKQRSKVSHYTEELQVQLIRRRGAGEAERGGETPVADRRL